MKQLVQLIVARGVPLIFVNVFLEQLGAEKQAVLLRVAACCCHLRLLGIASAIPVNAAARSKQIERAVDGDAMQPRSEVRALFEPRQLLVRAKESLLHHIVGIVFISRHPIRQSKDGLTVALHQLPERVGVAVARPAHGYSVSHLHPD